MHSKLMFCLKLTDMWGAKAKAYLLGYVTGYRMEGEICEGGQINLDAVKVS